MKKRINNRSWVTPLTIGTGIFTMVTGLIMLFVTELHVSLAHEFIGLLFSLAIILHILNNFTSMKRYFSKLSANSISIAVWGIGIAMITTSLVLKTPDVEMVVLDYVKQSSIASVSDFVKNDIGLKLRVDGYAIGNLNISIQEFADRFSLDIDDVLLSIFK